MSDTFFGYLKGVENSRLATTKDPKYVVHDSPEGGLETIGYGHKLNVLEKSLGRVYRWDIGEIDEEIASAILALDIEKVSAQLSQTVPAWDKRSQRQQEILTDYQFNLGNVAHVFPKFYGAVLRRDIDVQREEYKRYYRDNEGHWRELRERNKLFHSRYLSEIALKGWDRL